MNNTALPLYLHELLEKIRDAEEICRLEGVMRAKIEFSDAYIELNRQEDLIRSKKALLLAPLSDSSARLLGLKTSLISVMEREGREVVGDYRGKFREKKGVNTERVFDVLQGDMGHFLRLAKITQTDLAALASVEGGDKGDQLLDCVEVVERKLVDVVPITPDR